jgi:hypothetical protein
MPQVPSQSHQPATSKAEIVSECLERFRIAQEAESENRQQAVLDLEFEDGQQWPDDLYNLRKVSRRPTLTINHTRTFVRRVVNNMRQQRPRIKVHPVGEGADMDLAQKVQGLIRHIEQRSDGATAYDVGGESAVKIGWGYWRVLSEYIDANSFEQELKLLPIRNPFTVYMDPASILPSGEDMDWCIISEKMKRSEFERKYPDQAETPFHEGASGDQGTEWETKEEIRLAEYFRIVKVKDELLKLQDGSSVYRSQWNKQIPVGKNLQGKEISRPTYRRQIQWHRLNGMNVVESIELPGEWIPVIRCEGNVLDLNGKIRRRGMVRDMQDTARMYNYWRTCETEVIALSPRAPFIGTPNQFEGHPEWADANQKPYSKLTYTPDFIEQPDGSKVPLPPPQRMEPVAIPAGFVNAAEGAMKDLMILAGMPHEPGQDQPGVIVSGKALRERQSLSDISHFQYYDNQTRAICHTGRILLNLIPHYYSEQRMQRIIGDDGVPETIGINQRDPSLNKIKNDVTVGRYDVVMDTGPGYETKRMEGAEALIDLMKTPMAEPIIKVAADLVARNLDIPGASELADRLAPLTPQGLDKAIKSLPKEAQGIVQSMQQQLTQAQQTIQQLQLEAKFRVIPAHMAAEVKAHDTETMAKVKERDTDVRADTEIKKAHIDSVTKRDVAEIQAGAKILDTHVKGAHTAAQGERDAIHAAEQAEREPKGEK